jgi:hypothetical protein
MIFRLALIVTFLFSEESQNFKIDFFGLPAATVNLHIIDTLYNRESNKLIYFQTESISIIKYIFNVNNQYETIISQDAKSILSFSKNTSQPNLTNQLKTSRVNSKTFYNNSSRIIPDNHFNIFSLLYFLSNNKIIDIQNINIEREGLIYNGVITPIKVFDNNRILYNLELIKKDYIDNQYVIKNTDIFTWALFKESARREILVDYNDNNIIECIFKHGKIKMSAKNIKYFE